MSDNQIYALANVLVNGSLLAEEMSVTLSRDSKAQEIETVVKGFSGISPGAARTTLEVESAVPAADFELQPDKYWSNSGVPQKVEATVFVGSGRVLTFKGFIISDNFTHAVNSPSKLKMTIVGGFASYV